MHFLLIATYLIGYSIASNIVAPNFNYQCNCPSRKQPLDTQAFYKAEAGY